MRQYRRDNKESIKENLKRHYQDNKEIRLANMKQYQQDNEESIKARKKQYNQDNKEVISTRRKQYYQAQKEKRTCICGTVYNYNITQRIKKHNATQKHQAHIQLIHEKLGLR